MLYSSLIIIVKPKMWLLKIFFDREDFVWSCKIGEIRFFT